MLLLFVVHLALILTFVVFPERYKMRGQIQSFQATHDMSPWYAYKTREGLSIIEDGPSVCESESESESAFILSIGPFYQ